MESTYLPVINKAVSRIGLGTWAMGGWMWGGSIEQESIDTIVKAVDLGVNLIDTAPVYGFGFSEEVVGKALKKINNRSEIVISTKCGLEWKEGKVFRNASRERINKEVGDSLKRLRTDYIDIYYVHWPDSLVSLEETGEAMYDLFKSGKILSVGVSNFNTDQMLEFGSHSPIHFSQPPYNIFERDIEKEELPYCLENNIFLMTYGAICRGLLSGKLNIKSAFKGDDLRKADPKFREPRFRQYLDAVTKLNQFAEECYGKTAAELAIKWILQNGVSIALLGARTPDQLSIYKNISGWKITSEDFKRIDGIIKETVKDPVGPEFMAPPIRKEREVRK
ncbi:aldo/keto reductase [Sporocytophaga myxococcoides]|uniref:aldo/keto reductase n=1 Tax=Sporocytophaga myxococcoides TaxID=153721 RepID=UPI0004105CA9|nr:aldo/keto reductase [Sporocytophaga myxococcoides]